MIGVSHPMHLRREVWHAEEMALVLRKKYTGVPWEDQVPRAVYRGSCYPTANPDSLEKEKYLFLRGGLCQVVSKANLNDKIFDVGATMPVCGTALDLSHRHHYRPRVRAGRGIPVLHGGFLWQAVQAVRAMQRHCTEHDERATGGVQVPGVGGRYGG